MLTLVGLSGTGKSTVARLLAERWAWACVDVDQRVEAAAQRSIAEIFADEGEPAFRALESAQLREVLANDKTVIAAGGGAPCHGDAMDEILSAGPCVWLHAAVDVLADRVIQSEERPLLGTVDKTRIMDHLSAQLTERESIYGRAHFSVSTEGREPTAIVDAIEALIRSSGEVPWAP